MNTHITSILPARITKCPHEKIRQDWLCTTCDEVNDMRDDCAEAISRANLVVCPTEEKLSYFIAKKFPSVGVYYDERKIAKALLALLHRTAPQNVSNSATQEKR